jgi:hypothetical protein
MYCGPDAVARLTGWTRDQVWLHIRALREQQGKALRDHPYGGTCMGEYHDALARAGYVVERIFDQRRMRYDVFVRDYGRTGMWLLHQRNHVFARKSGDPIRVPHAIITAAYRVRRRGLA